MRRSFGSGLEYSQGCPARPRRGGQVEPDQSVPPSPVQVAGGAQVLGAEAPTSPPVDGVSAAETAAGRVRPQG